MSETIKVTYEVTYQHDDVIKDMLDSGEYGLGGYPVTDQAILWNVLDKFVTMDGLIPVIPSGIDTSGTITIHDGWGNIIYQHPGFNTLAEREDDHDSRRYL